MPLELPFVDRSGEPSDQRTYSWLPSQPTRVPAPPPSMISPEPERLRTVELPPCSPSASSPGCPRRSGRPRRASPPAHRQHRRRLGRHRRRGGCAGRRSGFRRGWALTRTQAGQRRPGLAGAPVDSRETGGTGDPGRHAARTGLVAVGIGIGPAADVRDQRDQADEDDDPLHRPTSPLPGTGDPAQRGAGLPGGDGTRTAPRRSVRRRVPSTRIRARAVFVRHRLLQLRRPAVIDRRGSHRPLWVVCLHRRGRHARSGLPDVSSPQPDGIGQLGMLGRGLRWTGNASPVSRSGSRATAR